MSDTTFGFEKELYSFSYDTNFVSASNVKKRKPRSSLRHQILIGVVSILCLFLLGEAVFYFFILPATTTANVSFEGNYELNKAALLKIAGLKGTEKWTAINSLEISQRLAVHPLLSQATVTKKFPDKVFISVRERESVAVAFAQVEGKTVPLEIDKYGVVFRIAGLKKDMSLPIISSLEFENPQVGIKVHKQLVPLFTQLDILSRENPVLLAEVSEISIHQKKYGGYDLIIYPIRTGVKVRADGALNEGVLRYMMLLLDVFRDLDLDSKVDELDIRSGTATYRLRGEVSG